jgi:hypothetical protein
MAKISPDFVWSDAWILLAISYADQPQGAELPEIVATADGINHAIPSATELDGALNRLLAAGLIRRHKDAIAVTAAGSTAVKKASGRRKSLYGTSEDLGKLLACPCCGPRLRSVRRRVTITRAHAKRAYDAYVSVPWAHHWRTL